jgi:release factor glutamine methyltransferase
VIRDAAGERLEGLGPETPREQARRAVADAFHAAGLPCAGLDARVLICAALGIDHAELVREPDRPLGNVAERLRELAERRLRREPVSRLVGVREFWGMPLAIDPHVLDPRPDTETLVEAVIDRLAAGRATPRRILDLGVGSGAILCALLQSVPNGYGVGVDSSAGACAVARGNLSRAGLSARSAILCGRWTEALGGTFDVIVSNPPYIPSAEISALDVEVRVHDPSLALDGGHDGLDAYRAIAPGLAARLAEGGLVAFEIGAGQARGVTAILNAAGFEAMTPVRDLAGRDRVVLAHLDKATRPIRGDAARRDELPQAGSGSGMHGRAAT